MKYIGIIAVILLASVLRLYSIATIPTSMSDDEIRETEEAYSIAQTGKSLAGEFLPMTFTQDGFAFAPVPIYASAIILKVFPLNEWSARLSYALAGIATVYLLFLVVLELFSRDKHAYQYALFSALFLAITPWHIHISRFAHEGVFPPMFYLFGIWFTLQTRKKSIWMPIYAGLSFFLGFYSYAAQKIVYLPIVLAAWYYCRKQFSKRTTLLFAACIVLTLASFMYVSIFRHGADYVGGRIFIEDITTANLEVANERAGSHAPVWLVKILHNKLTYWGRKFLEQYSYAFSGQYLFTDGEAAGLYSLPNRGQLYLIQLPLILFGLAALFTSHRKIFWFTVFLMLTAPLPSGLGINRPTYTHRSVMMLPYLSLYSALGLAYIISLVRSPWIKRVTVCVISGIILYQTGSYLQQYYFEWPRYGGEYFSQTTKAMIQKVIASKEEHTIIRSNSPNIMLQYLFYTRLSPQTLQGKPINQPHTIGSIQFDIPCPATTEKAPIEYSHTRIISESFCFPKTKPTDAVKDSGGQTVWRFYEYP